MKVTFIQYKQVGLGHLFDRLSDSESGMDWYLKHDRELLIQRLVCVQEDL